MIIMHKKNIYPFHTHTRHIQTQREGKPPKLTKAPLFGIPRVLKKSMSSRCQSQSRGTLHYTHSTHTRSCSRCPPRRKSPPGMFQMPTQAAPRPPLPMEEKGRSHSPSESQTGPGQAVCRSLEDLLQISREEGNT